MAFLGVHYGLVALGAAALMVAFSAATQDIAMAAWRIEIAGDARRAGPVDLAPTRLGFRVALLFTDSLILIRRRSI